jgi:BMFP domain-containing protein YqiC
VKARLRRISGVIFRPIAVAFDPRLDRLEQHLLARIEQLENHVATDTEVASEMTITQARALARLENRLAAIEERLGAGGQAAPTAPPGDGGEPRPAERPGAG